MSRIFISHSSTDNAPAIALHDWLVGEGWYDLFLDLDPELGIAAGERWEHALNEAARRCQAVLFLMSKAWLASRSCTNEMNLVRRLNKRMFGILIEEGLAIGDLPADVTNTWQGINLAAGSDHEQFCRLPARRPRREGLARLKGGLQRAGLAASWFAWPPEHDRGRSPYRGLKPLEADDAGTFFGREAPTVEAIDRLRGTRSRQVDQDQRGLEPERAGALRPSTSLSSPLPCKSAFRYAAHVCVSAFPARRFWGHQEEVAMAGASREQTGLRDFVSTVPSVRPAATTCFKWSLARIRKASFVLLFAAMPPILGFALSNSSVKWLCLAWLAGIVLFTHGLSRRAQDDAVVLSVDRHGIHDCRFARRHILWSEIDAICATNMGRGHAVDIYLRCPDGDFYVITISMLWLDGNVSEMMRAVAEWRPDLVNGAARRALSLEPSGPWF